MHYLIFRIVEWIVKEFRIEKKPVHNLEIKYNTNEWLMNSIVNWNMQFFVEAMVVVGFVFLIKSGHSGMPNIGVLPW